VLKRLLGRTTTKSFMSSLRALKQEVKIMLRHWDGVRRARSVKLPCKLHIGCGQNIKLGWINIDLSEFADIRLDVREPLPFPDASATVVYSEHFFEHLSFEEGTRFLRESIRVLVPGGLISIGVPDAESTLRLYVSGDREEWLRVRHQWHPEWCNTQMHSVNYVFRQDGEHKYSYDLETLTGALTDCGFVNIRRRAWDPTLDLDARREGTLYVEGEKARCG
jgi:predicted SAM-dependent methyltransferase